MSELVKKYLGNEGKILGSKTLYKYSHPDNFTIFNSNLINNEKEKIWYGDIDLTLQEQHLKKLAKELNTKLYVFYESDFRFEKEAPLEKAVW